MKSSPNLQQPFFDALHFNKLTYDEWLIKYKSSIRIAAKWSKIKKVKKTGIKFVNSIADNIYLPWYTEKNGKKAKSETGWMDGKPVKVKLDFNISRNSKDLVLLRLPAIKVPIYADDYHKKIKCDCCKTFFVLDGCHRLTELKPRLIILDWIELKDNDVRYIVDFYNEFWRK